MSLLRTAKGLTPTQLAAIVDALYTGDPGATKANLAYFVGNVHNYLSSVIKSILPKRIYEVDEDYASVGAPFFATIPTAYTQLTTDGCSSSNKAGILLHPKGSSYSEDLTFDQASFYFVVKGEMRDACDISGNIAISNGIVIFEDVRLSGNITVTGGTAVFINCYRNAGSFAQSNGSTVIVSNCENFGKISVTGNNNTLWCEKIGSMEKDSGTSKSVTLASGMTGGTYVFRGINMEGTLDEGTPATEVTDIVQSATARPNY